MERGIGLAITPPSPPSPLSRKVVVVKENGESVFQRYTRGFCFILTVMLSINFLMGFCIVVIVFEWGMYAYRFGYVEGNGVWISKVRWRVM